MKTSLNSTSGFTLIEIITVILIISILGGITSVYVTNNIDSEKFETTRQKMEAIRAAILGDESVDTGGHRTHFGYFGDMGKMPAALTDLVTVGAQAVWAYDATIGFGAGWRGPYLNSQFSTSITIANDAWNNAFIYNTATLTSYGSDRAAGGVAYATDISMTFPENLKFSNVKGILSDGEQRWNGITMTIYYPVDGAISSSTTATNSNGYFSFSAIPQGMRAISSGGNAAAGPNRIVLDGPDILIPQGTLNLSGKSAVTYVAASAAVSSSSGSANDQVDFNVTSTYPSTMTASYITANWSQMAWLKSITFGGTTQNLSPYLPSGTRVPITASFTIAAAATAAVRLVFVGDLPGATTTNMQDAGLGVTFEWTGNNKKDSIKFATP